MYINYMKLFWTLLFSTISLFALEPIKPNIHSRYALLMDIDNGRVLYQKNGYEKIYPASTTKVAIALYLATHFSDHLDNLIEIEGGDIQKYVTHKYKREMNYELPPYWLQPDGIDLGIKKGEKLPFRMLLHAALMISANDAINALAHYAGKDIPTFMKNVNLYLKSIGCNHTHFNNPHGLHHPDHYSTPYDMALILRKASQHPLIREIFLADEYERTGTKLQKPFSFKQKNKLLKDGPYYYPYAFGGKTGHTDPAMWNLIAAATNGQRNLVVALHKADKVSQCYRDAINLFDAYFAEETVERLLFTQKDTLFRTTIEGIKIPIKGVIKEDVSISYYLSEEPNLRTDIIWYKLRYPIREGSPVGELVVSDGERVLMKVPVLASESIHKPFSLKWLWLSPLLLIFIVLYRWIRSAKESSPSLSVSGS